MKIRVYYEDTDAGGVVYHSNYLNYCERARSEIFFQNGETPIIDDGHFVVRKMECDFISSAKLGDLLDVDVTIKQIKKVSFELYQEVKKDNKVLFSATITLVLAKDGKPKRINQQTKDFLQRVFDKIDR